MSQKTHSRKSNTTDRRKIIIDKINDTNVPKTHAGIIALLWRKILINTGYVFNIYPIILEKTSRNNKSNSGKLKDKNDLFKEVTQEQMTFRTLFSLLKDLLEVDYAEFTITIKPKNQPESTHSIKWGFDSKDNIRDVKEDKDDIR